MIVDEMRDSLKSFVKSQKEIMRKVKKTIKAITPYKKTKSFYPSIIDKIKR